MTPSADNLPAVAFQTIAWVALTAIFFGYALTEGSIGALVLGAVTLVQTWHAWTSRDEVDAAPLRLPS